jgi:hypothetical protein
MRRARAGTIKRKILYALSIEMDFTMPIACKAFEQFGKRPFRAMAAVHKRRDDREPQVSAPTYGDCWGKD